MKLFAPLLGFLEISLCGIAGVLAQQTTISNPTLAINNIPFSTRAHWMRQANAALSQLVSPCPFGAFGTVIVNHTAPGPDGMGELVCIGANNISMTGNPTLHGKYSSLSVLRPLGLAS